MSFFISDAMAAAGPAAGQQNAFAGFIPLLLIFGVFYFLLIRPQQKRQKELRKMIDALVVGDEIVSNGGLVGKVTKVGDSGFLRVEIAQGVEISLQRQAVAQVLPKGTMKSL